MKRQALRVFSVLFCISWLVAACVSSSEPPTPDPNAVHTQAAQTVVMQLTLDAGAAAAATLTQVAVSPPTATPLPTVTPLPPMPTPTATKPKPTPTPLPCDWAQFVTDVTVKDGTTFPPNTEFIKTWRLKNIGSCTWTTGYTVVFYNGTSMSDRVAWNLPKQVPPGDTVDVSIELTAPDTEGRYRGDYLLRNVSGTLFGIGSDGNAPFWVDINVSSPPPQTVYEFAKDYCNAYWGSNYGQLPCPGQESDLESGFVTLDEAPVLENGDTENEPALITFPGAGSSGYISGSFPPFKVKSGDHFKTVIGCMYDSFGCDVRFQLNYSVDGGPVKTLGSWSQVYDGKFTKIDLDLSALAGRYVEFILTVLNNGVNTDDFAFWLRPTIQR